MQVGWSRLGRHPYCNFLKKQRVKFHKLFWTHCTINNNAVTRRLSVDTRHEVSSWQWNQQVVHWIRSSSNTPQVMKMFSNTLFELTALMLLLCNNMALCLAQKPSNTSACQSLSWSRLESNHRLYLKMDDALPLPLILQKWRQNISDTGAAILCF